MFKATLNNSKVLLHSSQTFYVSQLLEVGGTGAISEKLKKLDKTLNCNMLRG